MQFWDSLLGKTLADSESESQQIGVLAGIPLLGLDALSSSAYGIEAAMTVLMVAGSASLAYVIPISSVIIGLLIVVFISYRQTIEAYPNGGGSYTVAKENLGEFAGLLAAAALMLDYLLTVAVGVAAGVGALISAVPVLQPHVLALCLIILLLITIINLRGIKESGVAFMIPTYLFIFSLLAVLGYGVIKAVLAGGSPIPVESLPLVATSAFQAPVTLWLILRAFASGCTAMTGVEAVSNGVKAFREPVVDNARRTLTTIIVVLILMLAAIAYLSAAYKIGATDSNGAGYESVVSQLVRAIVGKGFIYFITIGATISVLALSANTAFADFPRLCQIVAKDNFLPHIFAERGRRLVFTFGILTLSILSAALLIGFGGLTDRLIPLYAIGAFLAFTLSQLGMVIHWKRIGAKTHFGKLSVNALGATATAITLVVVLVSKFLEGGWISTMIVPLLMMFFFWVHRHYTKVAQDITSTEPLSLLHTQEPIVIVPFRDWSKPTRKALGHAMQLSSEVYAVHVFNSDYPDDKLETDWKLYVEDPIKASGLKMPTLIKLANPYRRLFGSLLNFLDETEKKSPERRIAIVIPELSVRRWYQYLLHNQRAVLLNAVLHLRRDPKIIVVSVIWYLEG